MSLEQRGLVLALETLVIHACFIQDTLRMHHSTDNPIQRTFSSAFQPIMRPQLLVYLDLILLPIKRMRICLLVALHSTDWYVHWDCNAEQTIYASKDVFYLPSQPTEVHIAAISDTFRQKLKDILWISKWSDIGVLTTDINPGLVRLHSNQAYLDHFGLHPSSSENGNDFGPGLGQSTLSLSC